VRDARCMIRKRYVLPASTVTFSWVQPAHTATQTRGGSVALPLTWCSLHAARKPQATISMERGGGARQRRRLLLTNTCSGMHQADGVHHADRQAGKQASRQAGKRASRQAGKQASGQAGWKVVGRNRRMHTCQPSPPDYTPLPPLTLPPHCKHPPHAHPPGLVALAQGCAALLPGATQYWLTTPLQLGCRQSP
jgi:hypothetical protein